MRSIQDDYRASSTATTLEGFVSIDATANQGVKIGMHHSQRLTKEHRPSVARTRGVGTSTSESHFESQIFNEMSEFASGWLPDHVETEE